MKMIEVLRKVLKTKYLKEQTGDIILKEEKFPTYSITLTDVPYNLSILGLEQNPTYSDFLNHNEKNLNKKVDATIFYEDGEKSNVLLIELKSTKPELGKELDYQIYRDGEVTKQFLATHIFLIYINNLAEVFYNYRFNRIAYVIFSFKNKSKLAKQFPGKKSKPVANHISLQINNINLPVLWIEFQGKPSKKKYPFNSLQKNLRFKDFVYPP